MNNISLEAQGIVDVTVRDKNGNIKQHFVTHNRVVDTGLEMIASLLAGSEWDEKFIGHPTHMGFGIDSSDVYSDDLKLRTQVFRKAFTKVSRTKNTVEFQCTIDVGEAPMDVTPIREVGIFNGNEENSTMLSRAVFSVVNVTKEDEILIKWAISILASASRYDTDPDDDDGSSEYSGTIDGGVITY